MADTAPYRLLLGNKAYSSWSMRPWIAMRVLDLPFADLVLPMKTDGFKSQLAELAPDSPGLVPCLLHGDVTVWDSLAILEYLHEQHPDAGVWPTDPVARARARSVAAEMHAGFSALRGSLPMNVRNRAPRTGAAAADTIAQDVDRLCRMWRDCRAQFGETASAATAGPFLFGRFCGADAMFAPVASRFETYGISLPEDATAYTKALMALPAMSQWIKEAQSESWVLDHYELD